MPDFVEFQPRQQSWGRVGAHPQVKIRASGSQDIRSLAEVMAARGGALRDHLDSAECLTERLPILLVAENRAGKLVGWSGAQRFAIYPDSMPEWLTAGLTVLPDQRRQGIGAALLDEVVRAVHLAEPEAPIYSVINVLNPASIELHRGIGFREVARAPTFAGIVFTGGEGVLLRYA